MYKLIKRVLDFLLAALFLAVFWWVLLLCAAAIKIEAPGEPVMYNACRVGLRGRLFKMYKFRTMRPGISNTGAAASFVNLSAVGSFLRKFSLDELPQMINLLRGEMSLIGPRPWPERYAEWYTYEENRRHDVLPGITGYAQVNGRASAPWARRIALDLYYVDHISCLLDLKIVVWSIRRIFGGEDIFAPDDVDSSEWFDDYRRRQVEEGLVDPGQLVGEHIEMEITV